MSEIWWGGILSGQVLHLEGLWERNVSFCWGVHHVVYSKAYFGCQCELVELWMGQFGAAAASSVCQGYSCV